jgi:hypothetical protein
MFPTSNKAPIDFNQYKDVTPAVGASSAKSAPISSNVLAPTQPIAIPASQPNTESQAFQASLEGLTTTSSATSEKGSKMESSFDELLSSLNNSATEGELTSGAYGVKGGVDESQAELQDINSQLLGEQEGLRRTIEGIQDNAEGLTRGGVAGKIDEARRKSLRTQADLAVIQMAKQGRYDSAKAIADRAINAQLEKQKQQQEIRRFVYEENKEAFTAAEKREFETKEKERDRQLENQEYRLRLQFDAKIKQSDPMYQQQLQNARLQAQKLRNELAPPASMLMTPLKAAKVKNQIHQLQDLASSSALSAAVGPNKLGRFAPIQGLSGAKSSFIGSVEQLRAGLTLENLIQAKQSGAAFGGLSDGERYMLAAAATKLGSWAIEKDGRVVGYDVDEVSFQKELDSINNFAKLDYVLRGGDAAEVGVTVTPDGSFWTENTDGTLTQLQ